MDNPFFQIVVQILSWLALPVLIAWGYYKWVAEERSG